jgi:hypothetical protein
MDTCGAGWQSKSGNEILSCDRDSGRHFIHQDSSAEMSFVRVPGGALVFDTRS